jgi:alpha-soluble NSF attachment protein
MSRGLTQDLAEALEVGDMDKFTDAIAEFDSMTRLDSWKTSLLLRAKKRVQSHTEHDEPDLT